MNIYEYFNANWGGVVPDAFILLLSNSESSCKRLLGVDSFSVLRRHGFSHSEEDISENTEKPGGRTGGRSKGVFAGV